MHEFEGLRLLVVCFHICRIEILEKDHVELAASYSDRSAKQEVRKEIPVGVPKNVELLRKAVLHSFYVA